MKFPTIFWLEANYSVYVATDPSQGRGASARPVRRKLYPCVAELPARRCPQAVTNLRARSPPTATTGTTPNAGPARKIVIGEEDAGSVEELFAQARDAENHDEELLWTTAGRRRKRNSK